MKESDRKESETEKDSKLEILRLINRIMRHETINDLSTISAALELYEEKGDGKHLEVISKVVNRSIDRIKRLKELEESLEELREVRLSELLKEVMENYDVKFAVRGDCIAKAGKTLQVAIENIIRNAVQHAKSKIDVAIEEKEGFCEIRIADYGDGIPDELKERIFEEGFSTSGGMGLGLHIAKKIVERYGGSIIVEDNKPAGCVFVIRLRRG